MAYQMGARSLSQHTGVDWTSENLTQSIISSLGSLCYLLPHHRTSIVQALNRIEQDNETGVLWNTTYSYMQQVAQPNPPYSVWDSARPQQVDGMVQEVDSMFGVNQHLPRAVSQPVGHPGVQSPITSAASNINDLGRRDPKRTVPPSRPATAFEDGTRRNSTLERQPIARPVLAQQGYSDRPSSGNSRATFPNHGSTASSLATHSTSNPPPTSNASTRTTGTDRRYCPTPNCGKSFGRGREFR